MSEKKAEVVTMKIAEEKNEISHRAIALKELERLLEEREGVNG